MYFYLRRNINVNLSLIKLKILRAINRRINQLEIFLGKEKLLSYPRHIQIEPTNRCNQKCIMCPRNEPNFDVPFGDMAFKDYIKILEQIPTITNLQLNGLGEPLLHPQIFDMIKEAKKRKIMVSINSNVVLINSFDKAKQLVDSGLDILKVSIDTADPEIYQQIRQVDSLNQAIEAVRLIIKARGNKHNPQIWFNSIIMQKNYKDIGKIWALGDELGVDFVRFKPVDTFDIYKDNEMKVVSQEELFTTIRSTIEQDKNLKVKHNLQEIIDNFSDYYRPKGMHPCFSPWLELYIQYYGGVRLCCEFYSRKYDVGNILEEGFKKVWNSPKIRQIRKEFKKGNTYFPVCKTCNRFSRNLVIYNKIQRIKSFIKR